MAKLLEIWKIDIFFQIWAVIIYNSANWQSIMMKIHLRIAVEIGNLHQDYQKNWNESLRGGGGQKSQVRRIAKVVLLDYLWANIILWLDSWSLWKTVLFTNNKHGEYQEKWRESAPSRGAKKPENFTNYKNGYLPFPYSSIAQVTSRDHFNNIYLHWC